MANVCIVERKNRTSSLYLFWRENGKQKMKPVGSYDWDHAEKCREAVQSILDGRDRADRLQQLIVEAGRPELPEPRVMLSELESFYREQRAPKRIKERTLKEKLQKVTMFVDWCEDHHPEIRYVHEVTEHLAGEYMRCLRNSGWSGQTQNNHLSALRSVWGVIRIPAFLNGNPWEAPERVEAVHERKRAFTLDQVKDLYNEAQEFESQWPGFWPAAVALGFHTGLRLSDVVQLEAEEYCRDEGVLRLVPNKTWRKGQLLVLPLHDDFDRWMPDVESGYFWPELADYYARTQGNDLFAEWRALVKHATGLVTRRDAREDEQRKRAVVLYGFHSLRHTYVSQARAVGAPIDDIQYAVGQGSPAMTRHYDQSRDAASRTGELMPGLDGE
mgnify:FL=1